MLFRSGIGQRGQEREERLRGQVCSLPAEVTDGMRIEVLSKAEQVRRAILADILCGGLRPGERLLEARLSKELGVSQATVNAALQDLHNQGLVTKLMNRLTNVSRYTLEDIERLFAVRVLLEPATVTIECSVSGSLKREITAQSLVTNV